MDLNILINRIKSIRDGEIVFEPQLKILLLQCLEYLEEDICATCLENDGRIGNIPCGANFEEL